MQILRGLVRVCARAYICDWAASGVLRVIAAVTALLLLLLSDDMKLCLRSGSPKIVQDVIVPDNDVTNLEEGRARERLDSLVALNHPKEDSLQHTDDIDAAFRRTLYKPDWAIAFLYVFMEFFIVPVDEIFGARSSPSYWCVPAEMGAQMGAVLDYSNVAIPLADAVRIEPEPSRDVLDALVPAVRDELNQGIVSEFADRNHLAICLDDNIIAEIRAHIRKR
jgi:hypothetical protein